MVIDTDGHHGDGTQWSLYTDNTIMCYSIHETGKFLFRVQDITLNVAKIWVGYTVNLPLEPYTEHDNI